MHQQRTWILGTSLTMEQLSSIFSRSQLIAPKHFPISINFESKAYCHRFPIRLRQVLPWVLLHWVTVLTSSLWISFSHNTLSLISLPTHLSSLFSVLARDDFTSLCHNLLNHQLRFPTPEAVNLQFLPKSQPQSTSALF